MTEIGFGNWATPKAFERSQAWRMLYLSQWSDTVVNRGTEMLAPVVTQTKCLIITRLSGLMLPLLDPNPEMC